MPSPLVIIRQRRSRRDQLRRSAEGRATRAGFIVGFILSALMAVAVLAAALACADLTRGLPSIEQLPILLDPPDGLLLQPTRLYDRTGQHLLAVLAPVNAPREPLTGEQIPAALVAATLALADPGFREHPGYLAEGWRDPQVHPTLAQKLANDLLLWNEPPSPRRAIRERILAAQMTAVYGRDKVLEWYLNSADFGHYAYGIEAAAQLYLGKSAAALDLGEAALLAAIGQAPALNPLDAPQAAASRRDETLALMHSLGMIPEVPSSLPPTFLSSPSPTPPSSPSHPANDPAFVDLVLSQLAGHIPRARLEHGGLVIITTLDHSLQLQVACAVQTQLARLSGGAAEIPAADGSPCAAARLLPALPPGLSITEASAGALLLDPRTGQVLAAAGAGSAASHPAGTLLTPFVYLSGFTRGLNPASLGWDIPGTLPNLDDAYHGPVRLRLALANDYLPPAAGVLAQMGEENVRRILQSFGLAVPAEARLLEDDVPLAMPELAAAYGILANQGTSVGQPLTGGLRPVAALKVLGVDHSVWLDWSAAETQAVVSPQLAYLMNHVLSDETARWPSLGHPNPLEIGRPVGAKLGQTMDGKGAWAVGYTPQRVVVTWLGGDEPLPPRPAADLWHALMQFAVRDLPVESWAAPQGIAALDVCDPSGLLPTTACPNVISEAFITGNEPTHADTLYQAFQVNRETGFLATVFTPPGLVEARVYLVAPPEAQAWAASAGLPTPPASYDTVQTPPVLPEAHITAPAMFSELRGAVEIIGAASGADFAYYRLEYGQGLNPQAWVQVGANATAPVNEGVLAVWDTADLNGLYALRLLVVRGDRRVERAVILVSLEN
jgi:membrane peptidoglycan carboxypeptidase